MPKKGIGYSGTLSGKMAIPRNAILILYNPVGSPTVTAYPRNGAANWSLNFSNYGSGTTIAIDGLTFGYVKASSSGSIQFVYLSPSMAKLFHLDSVSPIVSTETTLNSTLTKLSDILTTLEGTLTVDNSEFANLASILSALQGTLAVDNSEFANLASILSTLEGTLTATIDGAGGGSVIQQTSSTGTLVNSNFDSSPASGYVWECDAILAECVINVTGYNGTPFSPYISLQFYNASLGADYIVEYTGTAKQISASGTYKFLISFDTMANGTSGDYQYDKFNMTERIIIDSEWRVRLATFMDGTGSGGTTNLSVTFRGRQVKL